MRKGTGGSSWASDYNLAGSLLFALSAGTALVRSCRAARDPRRASRSVVAQRRINV